MGKAGRSKRAERQFRTYGPDPIDGHGDGCTLTATVRFDDGTFSLTGAVHAPFQGVVAGGMLHAEISRTFPELAPLTRWHLVSPAGPMHYIPNTLYWLGYSGFCDGAPSSPPNLAHARKTACWPDMPEDFLAPDIHAPLAVESTALFLPQAALEQLAAQQQQQQQQFAEAKARVIKALEDRLPALLAEFRDAVESLGFEW